MSDQNDGQFHVSRSKARRSFFIWQWQIESKISFGAHRYIWWRGKTLIFEDLSHMKIETKRTYVSIRSISHCRHFFSSRKIRFMFRRKSNARIIFQNLKTDSFFYLQRYDFFFVHFSFRTVKKKSKDWNSVKSNTCLRSYPLFKL